MGAKVCRDRETPSRSETPLRLALDYFAGATSTFDSPLAPIRVSRYQSIGHIISLVSMPSSSGNYEICIICALPLEARAVRATFNEAAGGDLGKVPDDTNIYTTGKIGPRNVLLVHMPGMGINPAVAVASILKQSKGIKLALLVGICGGVPTNMSEQLGLGDVIVGKQVIQYDFGTQYPDCFRRKTDPNDELGRQSPEIRAFVAKLESMREPLAKKTYEYLNEFHSRSSLDGSDSLSGPPTPNDDLFKSSYWHMHRRLEDCKQGTCMNGEAICEHARQSSCLEVGCGMEGLERRVNAKKKPDIHFGRVASGNKVIRDGEERDKLGRTEDVIAVDMEGAGIWDYLPCVMVKAVCDYADSHKNKSWQEYAAFVAAACTKAIVEQWPKQGSERGKIDSQDRVRPLILGLEEPGN